METVAKKPQQIDPAISQAVNYEENNRRLSSSTLSVLKEGGFLKLFLPESLGGLEVDPLTAAKTVEEVASHNTAAGWAMMVGNTSSWWSRWFPDEGIEEIYKSGKDTILAGALHPPMQAIPTEGGFLINGRSPLSSNIHEASFVFVSAFVMEDGNMKMYDGRPVMIGAAMNTKDIQVLDTWHTIGMKATDSNDIVAENVFVPLRRHFPLVPGQKANSYYQGPLYKYAAMGAGIACMIAPVALAVARNAINEVKKLADKKTPFGSMVSIRERGTVQRKLGMAEGLVQSSRAYLHTTIADTWKKVLNGDTLSLEDKAGLLLAAAHTNQSCFQAVDLMYSAAGTSGIYNSSKLAHYFTDAQVIRQHGFVNESRYETAAQVYFGLPPDLGVLVF